MKRLTILTLAALFVLGSVIYAAAAEIQATGDFRFQWVWTDNMNFFESDNDPAAINEDDFDARQRFRVQIDITQSENLRGTVMLEIGTTQWGRGTRIGRSPYGAGAAGFLQGDGIYDTNGLIEVRRVFMDFNVPETDLQVRVGKFGLGLPAAVRGNPVINDISVNGIMLTYPINDMFTVAAVWARAADLDGNLEGNSEDADEADFFGLVVPITIDYFSVAPYFVYGNVGSIRVQDTELQDTLSSRPNGWLPATNGVANGAITNMYWAGFAFDMEYFDPLSFKVDFAWGLSDAAKDYADRQGWYVAAEVDYRLDFMTPGLLFWYASGNDRSLGDGSESLPSVAGSFSATTIAFDGGDLLDMNCRFDGTAEGTWGIALLLQDITFVEDLTHTLRIAYFQGTDSPGSLPGGVDADVINMSTNEHAWEVDLNTKYMIYENLSLVCEMGWATVDLDSESRPTNPNTSDAWKLGFGLQYNF